MRKTVVFNLDTEELESMDIDKSTVMEYINDNKSECKLYTDFSYYEVTTHDTDILIKINNLNRNIESFEVENAQDLYYNVKSTKEVKTCRIPSVVPKISFQFNIRDSVSKILFNFVDEKLNVVNSNLPIINSLRSTVYETNKFPRKLLMWEFVKIKGLYGNVILKVNFIKNEIDDVKEDEISNILEMHKLGKGSEDFRNHLLKMSGHNISDGREMPSTEFDFVSTSSSDLEIRSRLYQDNYIIVKDKILVNDIIAMGVSSHKTASALFMKKFISRMLMIFRYKDIVPCISVINYRNMFGFYPLWYLHPDVSIYGVDTIENLLQCLELIDAEDSYDEDESVKDVWRYFVPYYMSDDWKEYCKLVAKEKAKLAGLEKPPSIELMDEKDFMEFMLLNKLKIKPRQLTNVIRGIEMNRDIHFKPGEVPEEYQNLLNGFRCNLYVFKENDTLYLRDCINLDTYRISDLEGDGKRFFFKRVSELLIKHKLIFEKISPILYVCEIGNYVLRMSQLGTVYMNEANSDGSFMLSAPSVVNDDLLFRVQYKRYSCFTKSDADYKMNYGKGNLPSLVERAMYRNKGLDGFIVENSEDIDVFGTRREPKFDNAEDKLQALRWKDTRDVYNLYYGSNVMQWIRMGARGESSDSHFLDEPDWDRIIWYCNFNTWFASVEISETSPDGNGKEDLKVIMNNRYNPEYFYRVQEFYFLENVALIKANIPGKPWRICVNTLPMQYIDLSDVSESDVAEYQFYEEGKKTGIFALSLSDDDILFRCKRYIIVESDNHRYLISGVNECGVNVIENEVISSLDRELLKHMELLEDTSYVNGVWKLLFISDFSDVTKVRENLFFVKQERHSYGFPIKKSDIEHPNTLSLKFYVYIDSVIYVFRCCEEIESINRVDDKTIEVNGEVYIWNGSKSEFIPSEIDTSIEEESSEDEVVEQTNSDTSISNKEFDKSYLFSKNSTQVNRYGEDYKDWLYDDSTEF